MQVTMDDMSNETRARLEEMFGTRVVDSDGKRALFNPGTREIRQRDFSAIARETKQIVELSMHGVGETAQVGNRTYIFGEDGKWHLQPTT